VLKPYTLNEEIDLLDAYLGRGGCIMCECVVWWFLLGVGYSSICAGPPTGGLRRPRIEMACKSDHVVLDITRPYLSLLTSRVPIQLPSRWCDGTCCALHEPFATEQVWLYSDDSLSVQCCLLQIFVTSPVVLLVTR
jgi:hypothetical protein